MAAVRCELLLESDIHAELARGQLTPEQWETIQDSLKAAQDQTKPLFRKVHRLVNELADERIKNGEAVKIESLQMDAPFRTRSGYNKQVGYTGRPDPDSPLEQKFYMVKIRFGENRKFDEAVLPIETNLDEARNRLESRIRQILATPR